MKIETGFLRTRVARRVLALFVLCALLPIVALTVISYTTVARQLNEQSRSRMLETGKATANSVLERLRFLDTELGGVANTWRETPVGRAPALDSASMAERIDGLAITQGEGKRTVLAGTVPPLPELDAAAKRRLAADSPLVITPVRQGNPPPIFLVRAAARGSLAAGIVFASLDRRYLLAGPQGAGLPADVSLCVFSHGLVRLFCTADATAEPLLRGLEPAIALADRGLLEWKQDGERYIASYCPVFLRSQYGEDTWTIVVSQAQASVLAPLTQFKRFFLPVILLALWVVLLLSNVQIRRSMAPLVELQAGTRRIAARDFDSRVQITSGDEFEDLAGSFNAMAHRLGIQFNTLTAINEIDRAVLSTLDTDHIIDTVVHRTQDVLACDGVSVTARRANGGAPIWKAVAADPRTNDRTGLDVQLSPEEVAELEAHPEYLWLDGEGKERSYLRVAPFQERDVHSFLVVPVFLRGELASVIALGFRVRPTLGEDDLLQARRLADQVAVALANTRLLEELNALNWGALTALARAIDAKSPWTAGHSERVTAMALTIGRHMGLRNEDLDTLHRGGLLHDLGKIGVAPEVLDKPTSLTAEEHRLMQQHTEIGARILAPIAAFARVVEIVLHHHERWDGTGYPAGLAGEDIPFLARVLAVPDVFDAMTSDRPYRAGLKLGEAVAFIRERGGSHFDPAVVDAFVAIMSDEDAVAEIRRTSLEIGAARMP